MGLSKPKAQEKQVSAPHQSDPARSKFSSALLLQVLVTAIVLVFVIWKLGPLANVLVVKKEPPKQSKLCQRRRAPGGSSSSGDSRNCGDVVMPAIAANSMSGTGLPSTGISAMFAPCTKLMKTWFGRARRLASTQCESYHNRAWQDFIDHQIVPLARPVFISVSVIMK